MDLQRYAKQSTRKQPLVQVRKAALIDPLQTFERTVYHGYCGIILATNVA